jgi:hypothetical protein
MQKYCAANLFPFRRHYVYQIWREKNDTAYLAQSRPAMAQGEKGTILAPSLVAI